MYYNIHPKQEVARMTNNMQDSKSSYPLHWVATLKCIVDRFSAVVIVSGQHQNAH
jgi:hypothetical protein